MRVTALAGGVGGGKLLVGLDRTDAVSELSAVVNTGDDAVIYGVHISPDLDIVTYWLAGTADTERGWGIAGDTFAVVDALGDRGEQTWFRLGDKDLATCIYRTHRLRAGATLSSVTDDIRRAFGIRARILPMTDEPVHTIVHTADNRTLEFQEYFVRERAEPEVTTVTWRGLDEAKPGPEVIETIEQAGAIVLCPSNPYLSVGPILQLPGVRDALRAHEHVVAVSPIIGGKALKGPADRMLRSMAGDSSAAAVARLYSDFCNAFVLDDRDVDQARDVERAGMTPIVTDTVIDSPAASVALAEIILS